MRNTGLHKSDQQYIKSARQKAKKPEEEFLYATTASKRAERQRLVRFIRSFPNLMLGKIPVQSQLAHGGFPAMAMHNSVCD